MQPWWLMIQLSSSRWLAPQLPSMQWQGHEEQQVLQQEGWSQRNYFKKKSDKAMHNDQSLSAGNLSKRKSQSCFRSPSRSCSCSWSHSRSNSRSYSNHHVDQDNRKPSAAPKQGYSPKHGYLYSSDSDDGGCIHRPDKSDTVFATFSTLKAKKKRTQI